MLVGIGARAPARRAGRVLRARRRPPRGSRGCEGALMRHASSSAHGTCSGKGERRSVSRAHGRTIVVVDRPSSTTRASAAGCTCNWTGADAADMEFGAPALCGLTAAYAPSPICRAYARAARTGARRRRDALGPASTAHWHTPVEGALADVRLALQALKQVVTRPALESRTPVGVRTGNGGTQARAAGGAAVVLRRRRPGDRDRRAPAREQRPACLRRDQIHNARCPPSREARRGLRRALRTRSPWLVFPSLPAHGVRELRAEGLRVVARLPARLEGALRRLAATPIRPLPVATATPTTSR